MRRCLLRGLLLKAARRMRRSASGEEVGDRVGSVGRIIVSIRRNIMNKMRWQWLSGIGIGAALGVGLVTVVSLSPWIVAAAGVAAAVGINKFELE